jgi:hypothetical protein
MRSLLFGLFLLSHLFMSAQEVVSGRVLDADTKEPLAFVPFVIEGTRTGTTSDIDGRFSLRVPQLPVVLKASYVGHEPLTFTVADPRPLTVLLHAGNTELHAVQITYTDNPAHRIIRRTYAQRKENDGMRQRPYRYTSYSKTVFDMQADTVKQAVGDTLFAAEPDTTAAAQADTAEADIAAEKFLRMLGRQHLFLMESATKQEFHSSGRGEGGSAGHARERVEGPFVPGTSQHRPRPSASTSRRSSSAKRPTSDRIGSLQHQQVPLPAGGHALPRRATVCM